MRKSVNTNVFCVRMYVWCAGSPKHEDTYSEWKLKSIVEDLQSEQQKANSKGHTSTTQKTRNFIIFQFFIILSCFELFYVFIFKYRFTATSMKLPQNHGFKNLYKESFQYSILWYERTKCFFTFWSYLSSQHISHLCHAEWREEKMKNLCHLQLHCYERILLVYIYL